MNFRLGICNPCCEEEEQPAGGPINLRKYDSDGNLLWSNRYHDTVRDIHVDRTVAGDVQVGDLYVVTHGTVYDPYRLWRLTADDGEAIWNQTRHAERVTQNSDGDLIICGGLSLDSGVLLEWIESNWVHGLVGQQVIQYEALRITIQPWITSGAFQLRLAYSAMPLDHYRDVSPIAYNATAEEVEDALNDAFDWETFDVDDNQHFSVSGGPFPDNPMVIRGVLDTPLIGDQTSTTWPVMPVWHWPWRFTWSLGLTIKLLLGDTLEPTHAPYNLAKLTTDGEMIWAVNTSDAGATIEDGIFNNDALTGVITDTDDNIYLTTRSGYTQKFDTDGAFLWEARSSTTEGFLIDLPTDHKFQMRDVSVDGEGNALSVGYPQYISGEPLTSGASMVQQWSPAGAWALPWYSDRFYHRGRRVVIDSNGRVFVATTPDLAYLPEYDEPTYYDGYPWIVVHDVTSPIPKPHSYTIVSYDPDLGGTGMTVYTTGTNCLDIALDNDDKLLALSQYGDAITVYEEVGLWNYVAGVEHQVYHELWISGARSTSGTFTLTILEETTAPIWVDATDADILNAILALPKMAALYNGLFYDAVVVESMINPDTITRYNYAIDETLYRLRIGLLCGTPYSDPPDEHSLSYDDGTAPITLTIEEFESDVTTYKFDEDGTLLWTASYDRIDESGDAWAIDADGLGNVYTGGVLVLE